MISKISDVNRAKIVDYYKNQIDFTTHNGQITKYMETIIHLEISRKLKTWEREDHRPIIERSSR